MGSSYRLVLSVELEADYRSYGSLAIAHKRAEHLALKPIERICQEMGLVAFMLFFELLFFYASSSISFYVSFANLFSIILFPYLLIT